MNKIKELLSKINFHFVFLGAIIFIIGIAVFRLILWDNRAHIVEPPDPDSTEFDREILTNLMVYTYDAKPKDPEDMVIACFGNAPFADDRNEDTNLASLIAERTGAAVYNFAFNDSYLSCLNPVLKDGHLDFFSLYWLTTIFAVDNDIIVDHYLEARPETDDETKAVLTQLQTLDFNTVDVIVIMYDGSDYLAGRKMYSYEDTNNIITFGGALEASIQLIKEYFPHIQIIVLSPTYAYALEEDGTYAESTLKTYGEGSLASYVQYQFDTCYNNFVSFVDTFYGSVSVEKADDLLKDHLHLKPEARELVADQFIEAYDFYLKYRND